jgi:phosphohistidine phosphatase SixA
MKWPTELTIVRHGQSEYNALKAKKESDPFYQEFKRKYKEIRDWEAPIPADLEEMAREVSLRFSLRESDFHTQMTPVGNQQAIATGRKLKGMISLPDVIFVSPFVRTEETLKHMT